MAFKTMQQIITKVERAIYQSAGSAVQIYSQDILLDHVQQAFSHVFDLHWWPRFMVRELLTLDGVTGQTTVAPTYISDYKDLRYVYSGTYSTPLRVLPSTFNTQQLSAGTLARYISATPDAKLFKVFPITATDELLLVGRNRPADFAIDSEVPFDDLLMIHFAAWSYFTDDGSNPGSADKHQGLFESRLKQIEASEYNHPIELDMTSHYIPDRWGELPW